VVAGAGPAKKVALEAGQVVVDDFSQVAVPEPVAAHGARRRLRLGNGGGVDVLASVTPVPVVLALAAFAAADDYLVHGGRVVLARDEPNAVLVADIVRVVPVEGDAALFAGGALRRVR